MADIAQDVRFDFEGRLAGDMARTMRPRADQLTSYLNADPSGKSVPEAFWSEVEAEQQKLLALYLLLVWRESSTRHRWTGSQMIARGESWSAGRSGDVAKGFVDHSRAMLETATSEWENRETRPTPQEVSDRVTKVLGPDRNANIAITEVSNAVTDASEAAMSELELLSEEDTWHTENDASVCPICQPLHRQPRSVWEPRFDGGPPAHPNCRCWISYANEDAEIMAGTL